MHCSARTLQALPAPGEAVTLAIETHVREDQIRLFGFNSDLEREWFRLLQTVQGVGAKVALAVLGTLKPGDLATRSRCATRRRSRARPASGQGRRAHRHRMKDKAPAYADVDPAVVRLSGAVDESRAPQPVPTRSPRWSISAMASRRPPPRSPPPRARWRGRGDGGLIRLGLKELAR